MHHSKTYGSSHLLLGTSRSPVRLAPCASGVSIAESPCIPQTRASVQRSAVEHDARTRRSARRRDSRCTTRGRARGESHRSTRRQTNRLFRAGGKNGKATPSPPLRHTTATPPLRSNHRFQYSTPPSLSIPIYGYRPASHFVHLSSGARAQPPPSNHRVIHT